MRFDPLTRQELDQVQPAELADLEHLRKPAQEAAPPGIGVAPAIASTTRVTCRASSAS